MTVSDGRPDSTQQETDDWADAITTVVSNTFTDENQLARWLEYRGVDTSTWGKGQAKSVGALFEEIGSKVAS